MGGISFASEPRVGREDCIKYWWPGPAYVTVRAINGLEASTGPADAIFGAVIQAIQGIIGL